MHMFGRQTFPVWPGPKNAMRLYAAELICSAGISGFQMFKFVFCIYNKLRLHAEILKGLGHAILANFSTDRMVIELTKISK